MLRKPEADSFDRGIHLRWVRDPRVIRREEWITVALLLITLSAVSVVFYDALRIVLDELTRGLYASVLPELLVIPISGLLAYGTLVYLLARKGHLRRLSERARLFETPKLRTPENVTNLLVLIPSYQEELQTISRAILSAALQPYGCRRVVLLIDDPPDEPVSPLLSVARELPGRIQQTLQPMREDCKAALNAFNERVRKPDFTASCEAQALAALCNRMAQWFESQANDKLFSETDDAFFAELTFRVPGERWREIAENWTKRAAQQSVDYALADLREVYVQISNTFQVEITSFERKQFVNLSHAANKAMNINSYIGLLGGTYRREKVGDGKWQLSRCKVSNAEFVIPDFDFVMILDADTIVSPDYTSKLMRRFHEEGGETLGVVQSPYSTFPGHRCLVQYVAGAQTDIQYLVHQGMTHYNATYWVGANALVRVAALRDVAEKTFERGFEIVKYVRDRTLIEDTESTIDLARKGWRLFNEPERLAFSMTPSDFGSLLIQRRRWANGGLLLVPKLLGYLRRGRGITDRLMEGIMRLHYLIALGPVSMALLVALGFTFENENRSFVLVALIYYTIYARDLHLIGYPPSDIVRVVALNLILIPVNLMGMASSLVQALTGRKAKFSRTPKIEGRTSVPAIYLLAEFVLLGFWCALVAAGVASGQNLNAGVMFIHAVLVAYAIGAFIGYGNAVVDILTSITERRKIQMSLHSSVNR